MSCNPMLPRSEQVLAAVTLQLHAAHQRETASVSIFHTMPGLHPFVTLLGRPAKGNYQMTAVAASLP